MMVRLAYALRLEPLKIISILGYYHDGSVLCGGDLDLIIVLDMLLSCPVLRLYLVYYFHRFFLLSPFPI